jgi:hypothetical protein
MRVLSTLHDSKGSNGVEVFSVQDLTHSAVGWKVSVSP